MLKRIVLFVLVVIIVLLTTSCTRNVSLTIEKGDITNPRGEHLEYYIGKKSKSNLSNKLLVMIQGSGRELLEKFIDSPLGKKYPYIGKSWMANWGRA